MNFTDLEFGSWQILKKMYGGFRGRQFKLKINSRLVYNIA